MNFSKKLTEKYQQTTKRKQNGVLLQVSSADHLCKQMDLDQAQQNVRPDLDQNCLDTLMVFLNDFFDRVGF